MLRLPLRYPRLCWLAPDTLCTRPCASDPTEREQTACYTWPLRVLDVAVNSIQHSSIYNSPSALEVLCQTVNLIRQQRFTRDACLQPRPGLQASNVRRDCEYAWECVQQECQKLLVDLLHASATAASNGRSDASAGAPTLQCVTCCPSIYTLQHATQLVCLKTWSQATASCQPGRLLNAWVLGLTHASHQCCSTLPSTRVRCWCSSAVQRLSAGVSWLASVEDGHSKRAREPAQLTFSFDMQTQGAVQQQEQAALTVVTLDAATLLREALGGHPGGPYLTAAIYRPTVQVSSSSALGALQSWVCSTHTLLHRLCCILALFACVPLYCSIKGA